MLTKEEIETFYIPCPRFKRNVNALSCAHWDRYRNCRRKCAVLKGKILTTENFIDKVNEVYQEEKDIMPASYSCKGLPYAPFMCTLCDFVGKSDLGLRVHMTRRHKCQSNDTKDKVTRRRRLARPLPENELECLSVVGAVVTTCIPESFPTPSSSKSTSSLDKV